MPTWLFWSVTFIWVCHAITIAAIITTLNNSPWTTLSSRGFTLFLLFFPFTVIWWSYIIFS